METVSETGKVLLEKILFSLPEVTQVVVLIRPKKNASVEERFKRDIVDSKSFDRLRARHRAQFEAFLKEKVVLVKGDLVGTAVHSPLSSRPS